VVEFSYCDETSKCTVTQTDLPSSEARFATLEGSLEAVGGLHFGGLSKKDTESPRSLQ
jgi:hypothetical protein